LNVHVSQLSTWIIDEGSVLRYATPTLGRFLADYGHGSYPLRRVLDGSDVVAIFRHKADLERPISHIGIEGIGALILSCVSIFLFSRLFSLN
jgi:hypothetical protein